MNDLFSEEQKEILKKNFELLGEEFVFRQAQEEAGEFIVAINHYLRSIKSKDDKPNGLNEVLKEFADLMICLMQIYIRFNEYGLAGFAFPLIARGIEKTILKEKINAHS